MGEFTGKVAIVTGGSRGIGRATALLLAREGAGVVVNDLGGGPSGDGEDVSVAQKVVDEISAAGGEALADGSDISRWDSVEALIAKTVDRFGQLDILVASAGIIRIGRVDEIDEDGFGMLDWVANRRSNCRLTCQLPMTADLDGIEIFAPVIEAD